MVGKIYLLLELRFDLNKNKITDPCKLFEGLESEYFATNKIIFNFADNQIEAPYCLDKLYLYDNYEFNFE